MATVGSFSKGSVNNGAVKEVSFTFTNNIEDFVGSAANQDGRISETETDDVNIDFNEITEPDKFANAVGYIEPEKPSLLDRVGATICVFATSVLSGVGDVVEGVVDGGLWVISLGAEGLGAITGAEVCTDFASTLREAIAYDVVGEANKAFYENTEFGQKVNEASFMEYDSAAAQGIRKASKSAAEIAMATVTGGAGAMVLTGLEYAGSTAEKKYSAREDGDYSFQFKDEVMIGLAGATGAIKGKANTALGIGYKNLFHDIGEYGLPEMAKTIVHDVVNVEFFKTAFKHTYTGLTGVANWTNVGFHALDDVRQYVFGEKEFDFKNVATDVAEEAWYMFQTMVVKEFNNYVKAPHTYRDLTDEEAFNEYFRMKDKGGFSYISNYTKEQQIQFYNFLKEQPNANENIADMFKGLSTKDADILLRNLSDGGREQEICKILADDLFKEYGKNISYENLANYGGNFQKYIFLNLPEESRNIITEEMGKKLSYGILPIDELRAIFDPSDSSTKTAVEDIFNHVDGELLSYFKNKYEFSDTVHELVSWYDEQGKYIKKEIQTVSQNWDQIEALMKSLGLELG